MRILLLLLLMEFSDAHAAVTVRGTLVEKGTRTPLSGVNVFVLPAKLRATTAADGSFEISEIPDGDFQWIVNHWGYERLELTDSQQSEGLNAPRTLSLEKSNYAEYETVVYGKNRGRDDKTKTLSRAQFSKAPGSGGDPIRSVQNLPGVTRPSSFQSQVLIEGSAPQDTSYTLNGHTIPIIFHFGGLGSVVMPDALERVDYLSAGYGPEYGRANAGLVGVWTKTPRKDRMHGTGYFDFLNAGAMIEGPVGEKSGFLLGVRQSYISLLLGAIMQGSKQDFTLSPTFGDFTAVYETELTPIDSLNVTMVGSRDRLDFLQQNPTAANAMARGSFSLATDFFRIIPEVTHRHSERTISRWSLGFGRDWVRVDTGENQFNVNTYSLTPRLELERHVLDGWNAFLGIDNRHTWYKSGFLFSSPSSISTTPQQAEISDSSHDLGVYLRNTIRIGDSPWTWTPGGRIDSFSLSREVIVVPRLGVRYALSPSLSLRAAGGMYAQPPQFREIDATLGNPDIKGPRATHGTIGFEKDYRNDSSQGWVLSGDLYYKDLSQLVIPSQTLVTRNGFLTPQNYSNDGSGRAYGAEALLKMDLKPWTGWLSYTLSRSVRSSPGVAENLFQYDQTHNLTAIASIELKGNWTIGSRFRYSTGNPITPVLSGVFNSDQDRYFPVQGDLYSSRLGPFVSLDFRVDKKWVYTGWILTAYLDIQNVTNNQNPEAITYNYNYTQSKYLTTLPILPTFGLKGEF